VKEKARASLAQGHHGSSHEPWSTAARRCVAGMHQGVIGQWCVCLNAQASSNALSNACPARHQVWAMPDALAILRVVDAPVNIMSPCGRWPISAECAPRRTAHKHATPCLQAGRKSGFIRPGYGRRWPAPAHRPPPRHAGGNHRYRANCTRSSAACHSASGAGLDPRRVLSVRSGPASTEVLALAVDHGGAHAFGHLLEQVANRQNQAIMEALRLAPRVSRITDFRCLPRRSKMD